MKRRLIAFLLSASLLCSTAGAVLSPEDARTLVEQLYIDEVPEEVLSRETVEEIFAGLDRYSSYFSPEAYAAFWESMNDVSSVGLGIVSSLSEDGSCLEISQVYEDGSAWAAGIRAGARIAAVDGRLIAEAGSLEEAAGWMRGEEGTCVTLTLLEADGSYRDITMTRAPFTIPYTDYELVDGHIGYISCQSFGNETYGHFADMLQEIGGQTDGWILDLRDNSGGVTQAATDVAGIFTDGGLQSLLRDRAGKYYAYAAQGEATTLYPVLVLVNENTASSSELLSAAVRDYAAGLIIGSRTYGKGVAQSVVDQSIEPEMFADGDGVRITSYRFFSPAGLTNDMVGILPHLLVDDAYAADIAYLLCYSGQSGDDVLRVRLGSWIWEISVAQACSEAFRPAFTALLEALWPETTLTLETADGTLHNLDAAGTAELYGLTEYTPRRFSDAADSEYEFALNVLGSYGILQGDGSGSVDPKGTLTRAQLCALLSQLLNVVWTGPSPFGDVAETAWYAPSVNAMAELGFVEGDGSGSFRPDDPLTNEELITVLARVAAWLCVDFYEAAQAGPEEGTLEDETFAAYSPWARESVWLLGSSQSNYFGGTISYLWTTPDQIVPNAYTLRESAGQSLYCLLSMTGLLVR